MIEAAKLAAIVEVQTGDAKARLADTDAAFAGMGQRVQDTAAKAVALSDRVRTQQATLGVLRNELVQVSARYGEASTQAERKRLAIQTLEQALAQNERRLRATVEQVAELARQTGAGTAAFAAFRQIAIGALRELGTLGVQALLGAGDAFKQLVGDSARAFISYENLQGATQSLVAAEMKRADSALTMSQAMDLASDKSAALLGWQQQLALASPFGEEGIAQVFQTAQAYGFVSETISTADVDARRLTDAVIDYAAATRRGEEGAQGIALALGQIEAKGKVAAQELNQLAERGVNARDILANAFGVTTQELMRMGEQGLIPADRAIQAIVASLENDFQGAAARATDTFGGTVAKLEEVKNIGLREFFTGTAAALQPILADIATSLSDPAIRDGIRETGQALGAFVGDAAQGLLQVAAGAGALRDGLAPAIAFIDANANPAIAALTAGTLAYAAVTTLQAAPAAGIAVAAFAAEQVAAIAAAGGVGALATATVAAAAPFVALATVIYGVVRAQQMLGPEIDDKAKALLDSSAFYQDATTAIIGYTQASAEAQGAAADEAQTVRELKTAIEQEVAELARRRTLGQLNDAQYAAGMEALRGRRDALVEATEALNDELAATQANAAAAAQFGAAAGASAEQVKALGRAASELGGGGRALGSLVGDDPAAARAQEESARALQEKLTAIAVQSTRDRVEAARTYQATVADVQEDGQRAVEDAARAHTGKLADISADGAQKRIDVEADAAQALTDLARNDGRARVDLAQELEQTITDAAARATISRAELIADGAQRAQAAEADAAVKRAAIGRDLARTLEDQEADLGARRAAVGQDLARALADQAQDAALARIDIERDLQDRLTDLAQDAELKRADLAQRLEDQEARAAEQLGDRLEQSRERFADKRRALQERLRGSGSAAEQAAIRAQLAALDEQAAAEAARLEVEAQADLARLQRQHEREVAALEAKLAREQAAAQAAAARKADDLAAAAERERAQAEQASTQKLAELAAAAERERAQARVQARRKQEDLDEALTRDREQARTATAQRLADLEQETARTLEAARAGYDRRLIEQQQSLERARADLAEDTARKVQDLQADTARALEAERTGYAEREQALRDSLAQRLRDEEESYAARLAALQRALTEQRAEEARRAAEAVRAATGPTGPGASGRTAASAAQTAAAGGAGLRTRPAATPPDLGALNAGATPATRGGGTTTINVAGSVWTTDQLFEELRRRGIAVGRSTGGGLFG